jgi:hypothetical protein
MAPSSCFWNDDRWLKVEHVVIECATAGIDAVPATVRYEVLRSAKEIWETVCKEEPYCTKRAHYSMCKGRGFPKFRWDDLLLNNVLDSISIIQSSNNFSCRLFCVSDTPESSFSQYSAVAASTIGTIFNIHDIT